MLLGALPLAQPALAAPPRAADAALVIGNGTPASCTWAGLSSAIAGAQDGDSVAFNCGQSVASPVTITVPAGQAIAPAAAVVVNGGAVGAIVLDGVNIAGARFFEVPFGQKLELRNLVLARAGETALTTAGELTLRSVYVEFGQAPLCAGIRQNGGVFKAFDDTRIRYNIAQGAGGGVCVFGGQAVLDGTAITFNQAERGAGAYVMGGALTLDDAYVGANSSNGPGAGVFNGPHGSVTLNRAAISDGVANTALITATGGALYNEGSAHLNYAVLAANQASQGGGVLNLGTLESIGSNVVGNSAVSNGGGMMNLGNVALDGGALLSNTAPAGAGVFGVTGLLTITNMTVSGNSGATSSNHMGGNSWVRFSTVQNNTPAALLSAGNLRIEGSIVQACATDESTITSLGRNIDTGSTCGFAQAGDMSNTNPQLSSLTATNERQTLFFAPQAGSPAIDAGGATCNNGRDQHGLLRPAGAGCDIGSIETGGATPPATPTPPPTPTPSPTPTPGTPPPPPPAAGPAPEFGSVSLAPIVPGQGGASVQVQGSLNNIPPAQRAGTQVDLMYRLPNGQSIPLNSAPATLNSAGQFQIAGQLPSLLKGDAVPSSAIGQISVVGRAANGMTANLNLGGVQTSTLFNFPTAFSLVVVRAGDDSPIPDTPANSLRVRMQAEGMVMATTEDLNAAQFGDALNAAFADAFPDQVAAGTLVRSGINKWLCSKLEIVNQPSRYDMVTNPADLYMLGAMQNPGRVLNPGLGAANNTRIGSIRAVQAAGTKQIASVDAAQLTVEVRFVMVQVDATNVVDNPLGPHGYGPTELLNPFDPRKDAYEQLYAVLPASNRVFLVKNWEQFTLNRLEFIEQQQPVKVRLGAYPAGTRPRLDASLTVPGAQYIERNVSGVGNSTSFQVYPTLGHFTSFAQAGLPAISLQDSSLNAVLRFNNDFAAIQSNYTVAMKIVPFAGTLQEQPAIPMGVVMGAEPADGSDCGIQGPDLSKPSRIYTGTLQNAGRAIPPGIHALVAEVNDGYGVKFIRADLKWNALPDWYLQNNVRDRTATWSVARTVITATRFSNSDDTALNDTLKFDADDMQVNKPVENNSGLKNLNVQFLPASGKPFTSQPSGSRGKSWNDGLPEQNNSPKAGGLNSFMAYSLQPQDAGPSNATETALYEERFERHFGTGERDQTLFPPIMYGFVPLASVRLSASLHYNVGVTVTGVLKMSETPDLSLTVWPYARMGVKVDIAGEILGGLVARFGARANPNMAVDAPVRFSAAGKNSNDLCFRFRLDLTLYAGFVCNPFESGYEACAFQTAKTINALNGRTPNTPFCNGLGLMANTPTLAGSNTLSVDAAFATEPPPPDANPAIATDGIQTLALWNSPNDGLVYSQFDGATWSAPLNLTPQIAERAAVAFYDINRAVAVWNASDLQYTPGLALGIDAAMQHQHLAYSLWDGNMWSAPQRLTQPTTGDGGAVLAGCMAGAPGCAVGGEVTAAWTHIAGGTFEQHQFRVFTARFNAGTWSVAQAADPSSTSMDTAPALAYSNGEPVVAWVRDPDRNLATASGRRIALRRLNSPTVDVPAGLPDGVVVVSLAAEADGELVIGFTRAVGEALMSNTNELYAGRQTCAPACAFSHVQLRDGAGRALRGQRPLVMLDKQGRATITYRAMGFGAGNDGLTESPFDSAGMLLGTGDLAQVEVNFAQLAVSPVPLTRDGAVNWQNAAAYNPTLDKVIALGVRGSAPAQSQAMSAMVNANSAQAIASQPIVFAAAPRMSDFVLQAITPNARFAEDGTPLSVDVRVMNAGVAWAGSNAQPLQIVATWDGPYGSVAAAGEATLLSLRGGEVAMVKIDLQPPAGSLHAPHTLHVTVNPYGGLIESTRDNNALTTVVGGVPAPAQARVTTDARNKLIGVTWDAVEGGPAVASYRVYRRAAGGAWQPIGTSLGTTWSDLNAAWDTEYEYSVTALTQHGYESAKSGAMKVRMNRRVDVFTPPTYKLFLPTVRR
jgi:hypothetical protein